jgi:hypothetical protein
MSGRSSPGPRAADIAGEARASDSLSLRPSGSVDQPLPPMTVLRPRARILRFAPNVRSEFGEEQISRANVIRRKKFSIVSVRMQI